MGNKLNINIRDINQLKSFYGKTTEEMMYIISDNEDTLRSMICDNCPTYCELENFFKEILK